MHGSREDSSCNAFPDGFSRNYSSRPTATVIRPAPDESDRRIRLHGDPRYLPHTVIVLFGPIGRPTVYTPRKLSPVTYCITRPRHITHAVRVRRLLQRAHIVPYERTVMGIHVYKQYGAGTAVNGIACAREAVIVYLVQWRLLEPAGR